MKVPTQLLMLLVCTIGTTFAGQSHSTQTTPVIKIAKMEVLEQRLTDAQKNDPNIALNKDLFKYFAGKSFADGNEILEEFDTICDQIGIYYGERYNAGKNQRRAARINKDPHTQIKIVVDAIMQSNADEEREQEKIKALQPLILELTLKSDYPAIYDQLKSRLTPPTQ